MRTVTATRYVEALREGGSLPGLVEADDDGLYVVKFRGAGQGPKALVAEVIASELARVLELPTPEVVVVELDASIGRAEPDREIQDLLLASEGANVGVDFLPGALPFSPAGAAPDPSLAAGVVWFDAFLTNVDRTASNPNLLWWHRRLWLIDHGAALYWHHGGAAPDPRRPFERIGEHVLLPYASSIEEADRELAPRLGAAAIRRAVGDVPAAWFDGVGPDAYVEYLCARAEGPRPWAEEAERARG